VGVFATATGGRIQARPRRSPDGRSKVRAPFREGMIDARAAHDKAIDRTLFEDLLNERES